MIANMTLVVIAILFILLWLYYGSRIKDFPTYKEALKYAHARAKYNQRFRIFKLNGKWRTHKL